VVFVQAEAVGAVGVPVSAGESRGALASRAACSPEVLAIDSAASPIAVAFPTEVTTPVRLALVVTVVARATPILAVPSKEVPPIVRAVWSAVAVPALPVTVVWSPVFDPVTVAYAPDPSVPPAPMLSVEPSVPVSVRVFDTLKTFAAVSVKVPVVVVIVRPRTVVGVIAQRTNVSAGVVVSFVMVADIPLAVTTDIVVTVPVPPPPPSSIATCSAMVFPDTAKDSRLLSFMLLI